MGIGFAIFPTVVKYKHKNKGGNANWSPSRATKLVAMATSLDQSSSNF